MTAHSHTATIIWHRGADEGFTDGRYSRAHRWRFDGGAEIPASASPQIVALPWSDATAVDPEEAFVASLSSCHMLFFLSLAAKRGFVVDSYTDEATGVLDKGPDGRQCMTTVVLHPRITYVGAAPDAATEDALHHRSHDLCFIANSVKTDVRVEPVRAV